jgi:UPF0755 protein
MRIMLGFCFLVLIVAAGWVWVSLYLPYGEFPESGTYVEIPRGASRRSIARILAGAGIVRNPWAFEGLTRWRSEQTLQAGEYFFDRPATAVEVFEKLADGHVFVRVLVIPEGYSMLDIADLVAREDFVSRDDLVGRTDWSLALG